MNDLEGRRQQHEEGQGEGCGATELDLAKQALVADVAARLSHLGQQACHADDPGCRFVLYAA